MHLKAYLALLLASLLAACAAASPGGMEPGHPAVEIGGFVIRNALVHVVTDVRVEVPSTGRFAGCGNILPRSECRSEVQAIDYRENELVVSWNERGEAQSTEPFLLDLPADLKPGEPAWLEVVIYAPGLAGARLVQP